jgi:phenylacetate-coenzyme A ligase PaaK-like adenylate-forming protein
LARDADAATLAAHQLRWLRAVIGAARHASPYAERWSPEAVAAALAAPTPTAALGHLPTVARRDVAGVPLAARRSVPPPAGTSVHETSGSTGEELQWEYPPGGSWWLGARRLAYERRAGIRPFTRRASLGDAERTSVGGVVGRLGAIGLCRVTANAPPNVRAAEVLRGRPLIVGGPGKVLVAIGRCLWDRGWRPGAWPVMVRTFGEVLGADTRASITELWGHDPIDVYGATETGPLAVQCEARDLYHVVVDTNLVEIADDGRVIVTALWNTLMPAVRYVLDDIAVPAERPCGCGVPGQALVSIEGRAWDWLWDGTPTLSSGRVPPQRCWLSFHLDEHWTGAVRRWRVRQSADGAVAVEVEADRGAIPPHALDDARRSYASEFAGRLPVSVTCVDQLDVPHGRWRSVTSDVWANTPSGLPLG